MLRLVVPIKCLVTTNGYVVQQKNRKKYPTNSTNGRICEWHLSWFVYLAVHINGVGKSIFNAQGEQITIEMIECSHKHLKSRMMPEIFLKLFSTHLKTSTFELNNETIKKKKTQWKIFVVIVSLFFVMVKPCLGKKHQPLAFIALYFHFQVFQVKRFLASNS